MSNGLDRCLASGLVVAKWIGRLPAFSYLDSVGVTGWMSFDTCVADSFLVSDTGCQSPRVHDVLEAEAHSVAAQPGVSCRWPCGVVLGNEVSGAK